MVYRYFLRRLALNTRTFPGTHVAAKILDYTTVSQEWHTATTLLLKGEPDWTPTTSHGAQHLLTSPAEAAKDRQVRAPETSTPT